MKKIISIILLFTFVCSQFVFASNDTANEAQKLLISIKERIGDTSVYDKFESNSNLNDGNISYSFHWSTEYKDSYSSLSVTCDSNGIITNYYKSDKTTYRGDKPSISKLSKEELINKAYVHINKLNPTLSNKLIIESKNEMDSLYSNSISFDIKHIENGIEVFGDSGYVTLDKNADKIISYSINFTNGIKYEDLDKVISVEDAKKIYGEKLGLELKYDSIYKDGKTKILAVYGEKSQNKNKYVNAITGDIFEYTNEHYEKYSTADMAAGGAVMNTASREESLTDVEVKEIENIEKFLSKEKIIESLKNNKHLPLPSGYNLTSFNTTKKYNQNTRISNLSFSNKENESMSYSVDSYNGNIISYHAYSNESNKTRKITSDKVYNILLEALKGLSGEIFDNYDYKVYKYPDSSSDKYPLNRATLSYTRKENKIPYYKNTISIAADIYTGKIEYYNVYHDENIEFPTIDKVLNYDEAIDVLFDKIDYNINYIIWENTGIPVYIPDYSNNIIIDANNGKLLDYSLEEYANKYTGYNDIYNHYAKYAIEKLAEHGIYFEGDTYNPDIAIKQSEFIYMLDCCFGYNFEPKPIDSVVKTRDLNNAGIIKEDEFSPESFVTRADAAKFLIKAMGYDDVAKISDIYKTSFNDVTEYIGYISILQGMNIISGNGDNMFNPNNTLTRAQAAVMIYNYLSM